MFSVNQEFYLKGNHFLSGKIAFSKNPGGYLRASATYEIMKAYSSLTINHSAHHPMQFMCVLDMTNLYWQWETADRSKFFSM